MPAHSLVGAERYVGRLAEGAKQRRFVAPVVVHIVRFDTQARTSVLVSGQARGAGVRFGRTNCDRGARRMEMLAD